MKRKSKENYKKFIKKEDEDKKINEEYSKYKESSHKSENELIEKIHKNKNFEKELEIINKGILKIKNNDNLFNIKINSKDKFNEIIFPIIIKTHLGKDYEKFNKISELNFVESHEKKCQETIYNCPI